MLAVFNHRAEDKSKAVAVACVGSSWPLPWSLSLDTQHGWPVGIGRHWLAETKKIYSKSAETVSHLTYQNEKQS